MRKNLTKASYEELTEEEKNVLKKYEDIKGGTRQYYSCNVNLSSIFTETSTNGYTLLFINKAIRKFILEKIIFGCSFYTLLYDKNGKASSQIGFSNKTYAIFASPAAINNFNKGLFIAYDKERNAVYCNETMANALNDFFRYKNKAIRLSLAYDETVLKIFDYDINWFSLGEINALYRDIRKKSNPYFKPLCSQELILLLKENGYNSVRVKTTSGKSIPLEERKLHQIVDKGGKRYFVKGI